MSEPPRRVEPGGSTLDPRLLELLVCPISRAGLEYDPGRQELISRQARLAFPIRNGVPIMLVDEARPLEIDAVLPKE